MADAEAGEFWALFGGFAPLSRKTPSKDKEEREIAIKLIWYLTTICFKRSIPFFPCPQSISFSCQQEQSTTT
jgi:hypothetical protein